MNKLFLLTLSLFSPMLFASSPVERVITLSPSVTELAFSAGLGDKLIAVSDMSNYPEPAKTLESVSTYQGLKLERIMALQPDLIIAWPSGNPAKELEKLEQFGFNIYYAQTKTLEDIANNIENLASYSDDPSIGQKTAQEFRQTLKAFKSKYDTDSKVRYFYQMSTKPMITVAKNHWPSEVLRFCGGENVFEKSNAPYPQVGIEQVITRQPEVMFMPSNASSQWSNWVDEIPALKQQQTWTLTSDWISRPTNRTLKAVEQVCDHFHHVRQNRSLAK